MLLGLVACSQQAWNDRVSSRQEQALAVTVGDELRAGQGSALAAMAAPDLERGLPDYVPRAALLLKPVVGSFTVQTVSFFDLFGAPPVKTFVLQGGSGNHWALVRVATQGTGVATRLAGLNVTLFSSDPRRANDFTIGRRGILGVLWLIAALASGCTCLAATVLIWRGPWFRRRRLWTIGSLLGFGGFALNWSTGAWGVFPLNVALLGAQASKAGPYSPWLFSFGIPIVAIIIIVRWLRQRGDIAPPRASSDG